MTTALVIGYLPTLYGAYSDRERALMTIDDGSGDRITPTSLVLAWAPDADPARLDARFAEWERWATSVAETHGSAPMLRLFRSHDRRQNWITALGLLSDAALQAQMIVGASNGSSYWFLRRAETLFSQMTVRADLDEYRAATLMSDEERERVVRELYDRLDRHGFELLPFEMCLDELSALRDMYAPAMEYLIDSLLCPRGFWAPRSSVMPMPSPVTEP